MKNLVSAAILTMLVAFASIPIVAEPLPTQSASVLAGKWKGAPGTHLFTNVNIFEDGGGLRVQAWGSCQPKDCDWGIVNFSELTNSMNSETRGIAVWSEQPRFGIFKIEGGDLVVETYRIPQPPGPPSPPQTATAMVNGQAVPLTSPSNRGNIVARWATDRLQRVK